MLLFCFFFFSQKTAYERRISDWSSDVCSSDLMLHLAVILDRAKRRSGQLQPFARGPDGIAARRALAFEHPGFLLLGRGRLSIRIKAGMGEGADALQDRRDGRKERLAGGGGAHRPD